MSTSLINLKGLRDYVKVKAKKQRPDLDLRSLATAQWKKHLERMIKYEVSLAVNGAFQTARRLRPFTLNRRHDEL